MKHSQIALQLYTLRDHARTPADFFRMLERVREIGYTAVEFAGLPEVPISALVTSVRNHGLSVCANHESLQAITAETDKVIERAKMLETRHVVCGYPGGVDLSDVSQVDRMIQGLDEAGAKLREAGLALSYHNHANEFHRLGESTVFERILNRSNPENLRTELDIHWVKAGGGDPVAWCERLAGRLPILHVKDFAVSPTGERQFAEVGFGNLDIPTILKAAERSGCEWFVVEQDTCPRDPFDCVADSLKYLISLGNWTADCD